MNPERWKRVEHIYYSVLASPPARRGALLDELCSEDQEIRGEVESLLDARDQAGRFLSPAQLQNYFAELISEPQLVGHTLGHYYIVSAIGAGSMGEVYLAHDTRLDRQIALKILPARFTRDTDRVARFRREAKAASALNHPNIMTIYDIGEIGETWFIAAEFIPGVTLRERLNAGKIESQEVLGIAIQCTLALEAAHRAGIVHRDVKPENIMVRPDGVVKVVDFGLARVLQAGKEYAVDSTHAGTLVGTPRYMSPEQARGQKLDARSDIFSLGAVVYEMAAGRPAFPGAATAETFAALLPSDPKPLASPGLNAIVQKALAKDRESRYQTMHDLAVDLRAFREQPGTFVHATQYVKSPRFSRRAVLTGAGALAAGAGLYRLGSKWSRNTALDGMPMKVMPLTSFGGYKDFGSFSPDEERIVFSWNGGQGGSGVGKNVTSTSKRSQGASLSD